MIRIQLYSLLISTGCFNSDYDHALDDLGTAVVNAHRNPATLDVSLFSASKHPLREYSLIVVANQGDDSQSHFNLFCVN